MIIHIDVRGRAAAHRGRAHIHPVPNFLGALDDHLVPHFGLLLDAFAVTEQPHISEIRRDVIEFHLRRRRHPRLILQRQRYVIFAQRLREARIQPLFIANFQREFMFARQSLQEGNQHQIKIVAAFEIALIGVRELQQHRPQLGAQYFHHRHELAKFRVAIPQTFFVGDDLRHLGRENKIVRRLQPPAFHGARRRRVVKRGVYLDRIELRRVVRQKIPRLQARGIERARPPRRRKRAGTNAHCAEFFGEFVARPVVVRSHRQILQRIRPATRHRDSFGSGGEPAAGWGNSASSKWARSCARERIMSVIVVRCFGWVPSWNMTW